jgi:hypothetical protein
MKTIVNKNEIIFKRFLYSIIIPKDSKIDFIFHDYRDVTGLPLKLEVVSKNIKIKTFIEKIFYIIGKVLRWPNSINSYRRLFSSSQTVVMTVKNIKTFLNDLKNNGYNVDKEIKILEKISLLLEEHIVGSPKWKKDKLKLILIIYLSFEALVGLGIFFGEGELIEKVGVFILFSFLMLMFCYGIYNGFKKWK